MSSEQEAFYKFFGFHESMNSSLESGAYAARVIQEEKSLYRLQIAEAKTVNAVLAGKFKLAPESRPVVGDWVQYKLAPPYDLAVIENALPRLSAIYRNKVGASSEAQILAANIDTVMIAASLNEDLNLNRLERYLTITWDSGARAVIVLTKADLCADLNQTVFEVEQRFPGVEILAVTNTNPSSYEQLRPYLSPGQTVVIVGSSGVGKSTLINFLLEGEVLRTQNIREDDGKGRHTTTSRSIHRSRYGGLIMDTPGMRELQLLDHDEGFSLLFDDIEQLTLKCKFSDCGHNTEPGCAVKGSLEVGELTHERLKSFQKLQAELHFQRRKQDKALASEEKKKWKKINTQMYDRIERKQK